MKSSKQRRAELKLERKAKADKRTKGFAKGTGSPRRVPLFGEAAVNTTALAPDNSYDTPEFVLRGTYRDKRFTCKDCGKDEVWTATQQKWWYEIAKGNVWTTATRCRPCRRKDQARKAEARRVHLDGVARKRKRAPDPED